MIDAIATVKPKSKLEKFELMVKRLAYAHSKQLEVLSYLRELKEASRHSVPDMLSPIRRDVFWLDPAIDLEKIISRMEDCGRFLEINYYLNQGEFRLGGGSFCRRDLLCQFCAIRRGGKMVQTHLPKFQEVRRKALHLTPVLITLTIKNSHDLNERVEHLFRSLRKLKDRRRNAVNGGRCKVELSKVIGAFGSYEITFNTFTGWHPHLHMIALIDDWIDREVLSKEWFGITGDSMIVDVRKIDEANPVGGFLEVFKYCLKFSSMTPALTFQCYSVLRNRKKLFSLGVMRGLKFEKDRSEAKLREQFCERLSYRFIDGVYMPNNAAAKKLAR